MGMFNQHPPPTHQSRTSPCPRRHERLEKLRREQRIAAELHEKYREGVNADTGGPGGEGGDE